MKNRTLPFKPKLIACVTLALSTAGYTSQSFAADEAKKVERIEVTGSRIKRTDIEGPSPVQSISRADTIITNKKPASWRVFHLKTRA